MEPLRVDDPCQAGEFRLRARLGAGGMGRVYLGMSPAGRAVAVKIVHPELAWDAEFIRRFRSEVAAAQAVNGIYTAQVVATGLYEVPPWLATAYVPGPTLQQLVDERGPLPETALWRLAAGLAEALLAVHTAGLVHRDLKPNNVLAAEDGPRVIDFGVSRALDGASATRAGATIGTPPFMSPEQAMGQAAGTPSDVFSLGSVLCFSATGRPPFGDGNAPAVLYRVVHEEPALDGIPSALRDLITGCLAKQPALRPTLPQLAASLAARTEEWNGSFWPGNVLAAIRGYHTDLPGTSASATAIARPATTQSVPVPRTQEPAATPGFVPSASRRKLLTMGGGFGGLIVAGAAAGWTLDRPGRKTAPPKYSADAVTQRATSRHTASAKKPGTVLWEASTSAIAPYPVAVANGVVAVLSGDDPDPVSGDDNSKIVGYDAATGARRWTTKIFEGVLLQAQGGMVIVIGWDGPFRILGLDAATGKQLWTGSCNNGDPLMAIAGGLCVVPSSVHSAAVTAYDVSTGAHAWTFAFPGGGSAQPTDITTADGVFYVSDSNGRIWRVSADGTGLGHFTAPAQYAFPIEVTNGVLCGFGGDQNNQTLYALKASTGQQLWTTTPYAVNYAMVANDGSLYTTGGIYSNNSVLMRVDASTGRVGWKRQWPTNTLASSPLGYGQGSVLVGIGQNLCALDAATGKQQWQVAPGGGITEIAVNGTVAYVTAGLQTGSGLYAIQL
jgi:hypothetical protein